MGSKRARGSDIIGADIRRAALFSLALGSIGEDLGPLLQGAGTSGDVVDVATWVAAGEESIADQIQDVFREVAPKLEALGVSVLVFAATDTRLSAIFPGESDLPNEPGAA